MRAIAKALTISACVLALTACGGDDGEGAAGSAGTSSGGTGGGDSGSGGTGGGDSGSGGTGGGDSGSGGTGGGGTGGMMGAPVICGGMTCPAPASRALVACCVDDGDVCGQKVTGGFLGDCAPPAVPDDECESVMLMSFSITGCCDEGRCGIGAGFIFGDPCTSIEELQELAQADGGGEDMSMFGNLPMPKACTP